MKKRKNYQSLNKSIELAGFKIKNYGERKLKTVEPDNIFCLRTAAPNKEKKKWDPDFAKRKKMKAFLDKQIPGFSVRLGGETSIDITKPGIDKSLRN